MGFWLNLQLNFENQGKNEISFRLDEGFDGYWYDLIMNGENISKQEASLTFKVSRRNFTLKGITLKMMIDQSFNIAHWPDADEPWSTCIKSTRVVYLRKHYYDEKIYLQRDSLYFFFRKIKCNL